MDVESLQERGRRRGSCLDIFLVVSIVVLFVAVTALATGEAMVVMELWSKGDSSSLSARRSNLTPGPSFPAYKMQNFAYLEAISSKLGNSTMKWASVHYGDGTSVGSNFIFNSEQDSLTPEQVGNYFMYLDLKLTCTFKCSAGLLRVQVNDKLTCEVELRPNSTSASKKCWTVSWLDQPKLITQMTVPKEGLQNWKLELLGSGFGIFLVD
ncbi:uncharacterized protein [Embiotoca jacksoni]|uniref:uncharacterized protein n=1 Tax=Embiotoca jacksoni TaxID=100190 RepID=UPI003703754E